jgi:hypothetical protein
VSKLIFENLVYIFFGFYDGKRFISPVLLSSLLPSFSIVFMPCVLRFIAVYPIFEIVIPCIFLIYSKYLDDIIGEIEFDVFPDGIKTMLKEGRRELSKTGDMNLFPS